MIRIFSRVVRSLTKRERYVLVGIVLLILIGMVIETFSVSLILPLVGLISREDYSLSGLTWLPKDIRELRQLDLLQVALAFFVAVYAFKSVFVLASSWIQKTFSARLATRLGDVLFNSYLNQNFRFYLKTNSVTLIRKSQNSGVIVSDVIDPALTLLTDGSVAIALAILLVVVEPVGTTLVLAVFISATLIFQRMTKRRLRRWGAEKNIRSEEQLKILQKSIGGIRDVILHQHQGFFRKLYYKQIYENAMISRKYNTVLIMPRLWLELVTASSLLLAVVVMNAQGRTLNDVSLALTLYAGAAFRVLPTVNRLVGAFQSLAFSKHQVEEILDDLELDSSTVDANEKPLRLAEAITVEDVWFRYEADQPWVIAGGSVVIAKGRSIGVIGPSGAGKSTLIDLILGFLEPIEGSIHVDGKSMNEVRTSWMRSVGYVPQDIFLLDDSIKANIAFGVPTESIDFERVLRCLKQARLDDFVTSLPEGLETVIGERGVRLSGGQRQRLGIARALYGEPEVLLFDEATSSLDAETERSLMSEIAELGRTRTTIQVAHRLTTVRNCDDIYQVEGGRVKLLSREEREAIFTEVTNDTK